MILMLEIFITVDIDFYSLINDVQLKILIGSYIFYLRCWPSNEAASLSRYSQFGPELWLVRQNAGACVNAQPKLVFCIAEQTILLHRCTDLTRRLRTTCVVFIRSHTSTSCSKSTPATLPTSPNFSVSSTLEMTGTDTVLATVLSCLLFDLFVLFIF